MQALNLCTFSKSIFSIFIERSAASGIVNIWRHWIFLLWWFLLKSEIFWICNSSKASECEHKIVTRFFHTFSSNFLKHFTAETINFPRFDSAINLWCSENYYVSGLKCLLPSAGSKRIIWMFRQKLKVKTCEKLNLLIISSQQTKNYFYFKNWNSLKIFCDVIIKYSPRSEVLTEIILHIHTSIVSLSTNIFPQKRKILSSTKINHCTNLSTGMRSQLN